MDSNKRKIRKIGLVIGFGTLFALAFFMIWGIASTIIEKSNLSDDVISLISGLIYCLGGTLWVVATVLCVRYYNKKLDAKEEKEKILVLNSAKDLLQGHNITFKCFSDEDYFLTCDEERKIYYKSCSGLTGQANYDELLGVEVGITEMNVTFVKNKMNTDGETEYNVNFLENIKIAEEIYRIVNQYNYPVPEHCALYNLKGTNGDISIIDPEKVFLANMDYYIWNEEDNICLRLVGPKVIPIPALFKLFKIVRVPKAYVFEILQDGQVHYTTNVSGGGSSVGGALLGGLLFGDAGAIIGSRKGISTTTKKIDDRSTIVKLLNKEKRYCELVFEYNDYYALKTLFEETVASDKGDGQPTKS